MAASIDVIDGDHALELIVCDASAASSSDDSADDGSAAAASASEDIAPLLKLPEKPKINIFSVSYPRRKPREQVSKLPETETSPIEEIMLWVWGGSKYSGILCVALSSAMYFVMEVLSDSLSCKRFLFHICDSLWSLRVALITRLGFCSWVWGGSIYSGILCFALSSAMYFVMEVLSDSLSSRSIPLFETAFARCTIVLILSYVWLRRTGKPIFGAVHARKLLFLRALMGYLSLMSFIYFIQRLPISQAIVLNFMTPIVASIAARIMLREKLKTSDIGGLACSFFGVLFIYRQILRTQGPWIRTGQTINIVRGSYHVYAMLIGLFSSLTGGISYCLIKAGANASDQPVVTVFSFALLSSPAAGIFSFAFEEFVMPDLYSFSLNLILGVLAFFAEMLLARGLQREKTSKAANVQYIEVALSQLWGIGSSRISSSFGGMVGCLLILISVGYTIYIGPDKEME